jgi:hypothetical protein
MGLTQRRMLQARPWRGFRGELERGIRLAEDLGGPRGSPPIDLRPEERRRLVRAGVEAGIFYGHVHTCITNLGEPEGRDALSRSRRAIPSTPTLVDGIFGVDPIFGRRDPRLELPRFDPRSCRAEDVFDWTRRTATALLGDGGPDLRAAPMR